MSIESRHPGGPREVTSPVGDDPVLRGHAPARGAAIEIQHISKTFPGGVHAVDDITLSIPAGQFIAMIGPSGCGKSTLLRIIAGLERASRGTIRFAHGDNTVPAAQDPGLPRTAFVFQDAHLLPWRTVLANVALPLELRGDNRRERADAARRAIERVGLSDAIGRYPAELSGGMRMRVSLARALVTEPNLLLLDEPFAALDEITRQQLDDQLRALWSARGMTVIFVTHSIMEAAYLADRAIVLSARPARVVLDRLLDLPAERTHALRGNPEFAREMHALFDALERRGIA